MRPEENYSEYIDKHILPFILPRREEEYLLREPEHPIYCAFYTADSNTTDSDTVNPNTTDLSSEDSSSEGSGTAGTHTVKAIIVIAHGFTETADKYFEVIYYFLKAGYHVCIPEHCGHGRSYRLTENDLSLVHIDSWQRYADDLKYAALAAKAHWGQSLPLLLFAHSTGGGIGAALAAQEPHLFHKIVLSSPMIRPCTGPVPWPAAQLIVNVMCALGKEQNYVISQHPYDPNEPFEASCATSLARYTWYKEKTDAEPLFQTSAASYGWLREAARLNHFLMKNAWKQIADPVLLIQAENDTIVSKDQQNKFARKLAGAEQMQRTAGKDQSQNTTDAVSFLCISGAKHEIFRSDDATFAKFITRCLEFYT